MICWSGLGQREHGQEEGTRGARAGTGEDGEDSGHSSRRCAAGGRGGGGRQQQGGRLSLDAKESSCSKSVHVTPIMPLPQYFGA